MSSSLRRTSQSTLFTLLLGLILSAENSFGNPICTILAVQRARYLVAQSGVLLDVEAAPRARMSAGVLTPIQARPASTRMVTRYFSQQALAYRAARENGSLNSQGLDWLQWFGYYHPEALGTPVELGMTAPTPREFYEHYVRYADVMRIPQEARIQPVEYIVREGRLGFISLGGDLPAGAERLIVGVNWRRENHRGTLSEVHVVSTLAGGGYAVQVGLRIGDEIIENHDGVGHIKPFTEHPSYARALREVSVAIVADPERFRLIERSTGSPLSLRFQIVLEGMSFLRIGSEDVYRLLQIPPTLQGLEQYSVERLERFLSARPQVQNTALAEELLRRLPGLMDHTGSLNDVVTLYLDNDLSAAGELPDEALLVSVWRELHLTHRGEPRSVAPNRALAMMMTFLLQLNAETPEDIVHSALEAHVTQADAFGRIWYRTGLLSQARRDRLGFARSRYEE